MKFFSLLFFIHSAISLMGQNLVPNGDFETNLFGKVLEWRQPLDDYYHYDVWETKTDSGIIYNHRNGLCLLQTEASEFLVAKLKQPLVKGKRYAASMNIYYNITFAGRVKRVQTIDMIFCDTNIEVSKRRFLYREPRLQFPFMKEDGSFYQPEKIVFEAEGNEQYIIIGKFHRTGLSFAKSFEDQKLALYTEQYYAGDSIKKYYSTLLPPLDPTATKRAKKHLDDSIGRVEQLKRDALHANALFYQQKVQALALQQFDTTVETQGYHVRMYFDNICIAPVLANNECDCDNNRKQGFEVGQTYRLNNIHFDLNKTIFRPESYAEMDNLYGILNRYPNMAIQLNGHTDSLNSEKYNLDLSNQRAKAVYDYLVKKGISPTRLKWKGYGESAPATENTSEKGRAINRRVEFMVIKI